MKYTTRQYARALYEVLHPASEEGRKKILSRFYAILSRERSLSSLERVLHEVERIFLRESGTKKVVLETSSGISQGVKKEIQQIVGQKTIIQEKVRPELLAGIRIVINDEMLIDASAKRQIIKLFK